VRRPAVLLSLVVVVGALLLRRRRRQSGSGSLGAPDPAPPLAPAAGGTRFVSVPWTLVEASTREPRLIIRYRDDVHIELDRIDAQETPTQVFVTVLMRWQPPAGGSFRDAREHEVAVPLSGPLGERELVHAPVDEPGRPPL
jgi:hypothetical protein